MYALLRENIDDSVPGGEYPYSNKGREMVRKVLETEESWTSIEEKAKKALLSEIPGQEVTEKFKEYVEKYFLSPLKGLSQIPVFNKF